jgi:AmmeMemoRadiSam system protein A
MTSLGESLIPIAARSIARGFENASAGSFDVSALPDELRAERATFVTLSTPAAGLRGCRGVLEASRPLALDVWCNAYASAFDDPRFAPVNEAEFASLAVEISVLGELTALAVADETELRRVLVPQRDGVLLAWRGRRATFLPKVWESLPDPAEFIGQLKLKAGLPRDFWARDIEIRIYGAEIVSGSTRAA